MPSLSWPAPSTIGLSLSIELTAFDRRPAPSPVKKC